MTNYAPQHATITRSKAEPHPLKVEDIPIEIIDPNPPVDKVHGSPCASSTFATKSEHFLNERSNNSNGISHTEKSELQLSDIASDRDFKKLSENHCSIIKETDFASSCLRKLEEKYDRNVNLILTDLRFQFREYFDRSKNYEDYGSMCSPWIVEIAHELLSCKRFDSYFL